MTTPADTAREPRWRPWACFALLIVGLQVGFGPKLRLSQWEVSAERNAAVAEGAAWLAGRFDLPNQGANPLTTRMHDTALVEGKVYNVFPPLMAVLTVLLAPLHRLLLGAADLWLPWPYLLLVFWPLPIVAFLVLRQRTGDSAWAAVLAASFIGGTAVLPNLYFARFGHLGQINHVLSQVGLLLLAADLLGRQRVWPGLLGLLLAVWTRQMTCLYALPLLYVARRKERTALCLLGLALIATPLLALNQLKFGHPLAFGYEHIYHGREHEPLAQAVAEHGVFSPHYIARNVWHLFFEPPQLDAAGTQILIRGDVDGVGLFFTTPLMLLVPWTARRWWTDPRCRLLMLSTGPVIAGLLCYHSPGFMQLGYNRFALDFLPLWLLVIAPETRGGRRAWLTLGCTAWSFLYFQAVVPNI